MKTDDILQGMRKAQAAGDQEALKKYWSDLLAHERVSGIEIDWVRLHIKDLEIRDHAAALIDGFACLVSGRSVVPDDVIEGSLVAAPLAATA